MIGQTYTLVIQTSDGATYQSDPQFMEQAVPIDSIYGVILNKQLKGVDSYVNINKPDGYTGNFRFTDSLLIEAVSQGVNPAIPCLQYLIFHGIT